MENVYPKLLLGAAASKQVNELIEQGWEFTLHYGNHKSYCEIDKPCWESDFTRLKENGLWDNHKCGYSIFPDEAIDIAYNNIKNEIK